MSYRNFRLDISPSGSTLEMLRVGIKSGSHFIIRITTDELNRMEVKKEMSLRSMHATAFILSLIGGLVIVIGGVIATFLLSFGSPYGTYYGMGPGMMGGYGFYGFGSGWMIGFSLVGLVSGIIVVVGAIMLNVRPAEHVTWGILVLIFSLISFIGMGGYVIGGILGIAGGAVALSYRSASTAAKE